MTEERYILVYRNNDGETRSIRTWTIDDAQQRAGRLNAVNYDDPRGDKPGRWTVHELSDEIQP